MKLRILILASCLLALVLSTQGHAQSISTTSIPEIDSPGAITISAGLNHSCLVTSSGGVKCWGENVSGQLGIDSKDPKIIPTDVIGLNSGATAVAAGWSHTCALMDNGSVKCWGNNYSGQLGTGDTAQSLTPVDVIGLTSPVVSISAGWNYTCAATSDGGAVCWGANGYGKLGDGTTGDRWQPTGVNGLTSGVADIAAGQVHTCALTISGDVKCWGYNGFGQLGKNPADVSSSPIPLDVLEGAKAIGVGWHHSCVVALNGGIECWGRNEYGQLGNDSTADSWVPTPVSGISSGANQVKAGFSHTCASTSDGAKCWGLNQYGQLGNDDTTINPSLTPVPVNGISGGVIALGAGQHHNCLVNSVGGAKCWGYNYRGQVGDNSYTDRDSPACVFGFCIEPTPQQIAENVIEYIEGLFESGVLNQGRSNALITKLETAIKKLDDGKVAQAINQFEALINQVEAMIQSGQLLPIEGQPIIDAVNEILVLLE